MNNKGFTLLEVLIALMIAGVLAAISIPSLYQMVRSNRVKESQSSLVSYLRDVQRNSIRLSRTCTATFNINGTTFQGVTNSCPITNQLDITSDVRVLMNSSTITYNFKGATSDERIYVFHDGKQDGQRCVVVSSHLGILRSGVYRGSLGSMNVNQCESL